MTISVVMPVWNGVRTIREATRSALDQTHADLELIVVDDGSSDGSLEAIADIDDHRILRLVGDRTGPSAARNRGILASRGELVAFLDADDLWDPRKLERQVEALDADPDASVAYCWLDRIAFDGSEREALTRETQNGDVYPRLLVANFVGGGCNLLVKRATLDDVGLFDESLDAAEDWELNVRLASRHRFVCVEEPLVLKRQTPGSISADFRRLERGFRAASRKIYRAAPRKYRHLAKEADLCFYEWLAAQACRECRTRRQALTALRYLLKGALRCPRKAWQPWRRRTFRTKVALALEKLFAVGRCEPIVH